MAYKDAEKFERFFSSYNDGFSYVYFFNPETGDVCLEYDIEMEAKYIYCYSLYKHKRNWLLEITEHARTEVGTSQPASTTYVMGNDKEEAVEAVIELILKKPKGHEEAQVNIVELEEKLRKIFEKFKN